MQQGIGRGWGREVGVAVRAVLVEDVVGVEADDNYEAVKVSREAYS
jgi:hypothetical protein